MVPEIGTWSSPLYFRVPLIMIFEFYLNTIRNLNFCRSPALLKNMEVNPHRVTSNLVLHSNIRFFLGKIFAVPQCNLRYIFKIALKAIESCTVGQYNSSNNSGVFMQFWGFQKIFEQISLQIYVKLLGFWGLQKSKNVKIQR